jgi:hypothetical protein
MLGRHKLLILIPALILIPILLGMTPLNFVDKIGAGCPFSQGKQTLSCNPCPFNSVISQDDPTILNLNLTPLDQESLLVQEFGTSLLESANSNISFNSVPLRC